MLGDIKNKVYYVPGPSSGQCNWCGRTGPRALRDTMDTPPHPHQNAIANRTEGAPLPTSHQAKDGPAMYTSDIMGLVYSGLPKLLPLSDQPLRMVYPHHIFSI